jgi:hypothetical protein
MMVGVYMEDNFYAMKKGTFFKQPWTMKIYLMYLYKLKKKPKIDKKYNENFQTWVRKKLKIEYWNKNMKIY